MKKVGVSLVFMGEYHIVSHGHNSNCHGDCTDGSEASKELIVRLLSPAPLVVFIDNFVDAVSHYRCCHFSGIVLTLDIHTVEVVVLGFIEVWNIPVKAKVLQAQVIPIVCIRVIGDLVVMDILARHVAAIDLDKLLRVNLLRSACLLAESSRDPAASDNQGSSLDADRVLQRQTLLH